VSGPRCGAKCRDGHACTQWAMAGQTRCKQHGGKTPSHLRAGARRIAEQRAAKSIQRAGVDVAAVSDPVSVLRSLASEALALKEFFKQRVDALSEMRYQSGSGEQTRAELLLFERALDRSQKFANDLARLGISERHVQVDEARVVLIAAVLQRVLEAPELRLDSSQQSRARVLLVEALNDA